jgi:GH24 family phage-related lysozyme (muramidase)
MALERTKFGSPIDTGGRTVRSTRGRSSQTSTVISQMGALAAGIAASVADQQDINAQLDAQNDMINDAINPDRQHTEAMYAVSTAELQAQQGWSEEALAIDNGDYDEMTPEGYQADVKERHRVYRESWKNNPNAGMAIGAYNNYMLKQQPALVAAQNGRWRLDQKKKQGMNLTLHVSQLAKDPNTTIDHYINTLSDPKYNLLDPEAISKAAFMGAAKSAVETGDIEVLEALNLQFGYDVSSFKGLYDTAIIQAKYTRDGLDLAEIDTQKDQYESLMEQGILTEESVAQMALLADKKGRQVYTEAKIKSMFTKSEVNRDRIFTEEKHLRQAKAGVNIQGTPAQFAGTMGSLYDGLVTENPDDMPTVLYGMGQHVVKQDSIWKQFQSQVKMFDAMPMTFKDGTINPESLQSFKAIEAFEKGLMSEAPIAGARKFAEYMDDSLESYVAIQSNLARTAGPIEETYPIVATILDNIDTDNKAHETYAEYTDEEQEVALDAVNDAFNTKVGWSGLWRDPEKTIQAEAFVLADIARLRKSGHNPEDAKNLAIKNLVQNSVVVDNQLLMIKPTVAASILGCSTSQIDVGIDLLKDDLKYEGRMKEMFGIKEGIAFGAKDVPMEQTGWMSQIGAVAFIQGIFGDERVLTADQSFQAKINQQKLMAADVSGDGWDKIKVDTSRARININEDTGYLELSNPMNPEAGVLYIPGNYIGAALAAEKHGEYSNEQIHAYYKEYDSGNPTGEIKEWVLEQRDLNAEFLTNVINTSIGMNYGLIPTHEYLRLSEPEKAISRQNFYEAQYSGAMGMAKKAIEYSMVKVGIDFDKKIPLSEEGGLDPNQRTFTGGMFDRKPAGYVNPADRVAQDLGLDTPVAEPTVEPVAEVQTENEVKFSVADTGELNDEPIKTMLKRHEGFRSEPYKDKGGWAIGYGHWSATKPTKSVTKPEALAMFQKDYASHKKAAEKLPGYSKASNARKAALIDITFNLGGGWNKKKGKEWPDFTEAMSRDKIDWNEVAETLIDSKWYTQVKGRGKELVEIIRKG